jgi:hypothetical protein
VSDTLRPPAAIRITRPYSTEEEFLEHELDMLTHTTVTLVGAQPRPQGVVLRFELVLSSGQVVVRGEGRVLASKPAVFRGLGGLTLRFTRLDSRSKAFIDKAAALRDQRRPSLAPPGPSSPSLPEQPVSSSRPPEAAPPPSSEPALTSTPPPAAVRPARASSSPPPPSPLPARTASPPAERDALLERLRARAKTLDATDVQRILEQRRRA